MRVTAGFCASCTIPPMDAPLLLITPEAQAKVAAAATSAGHPDARLREYARALSAGDLQGMQATFPGMSTQVRQAWEEFFKQKYSLDTSRWKILSVEVTAGGTARAQIGGTSIQRDRKGKQSEAPPPRTAVLDKVSSGWRITSLN